MRRKLEKRHYSPTFREQVVLRVERGELSVAEAMRTYGIGGSMTVYRWLDKYGSDSKTGSSLSSMEDKRGTEQAASSGISASESGADLRAEVESLRRLLELERLRSESYLRMIKLAEERYGVPIEKKSGAKQ